MSIEVFEIFQSENGKAQWRRHRKSGKTSSRVLRAEGWGPWSECGIIPEGLRPLHETKSVPLPQEQLQEYQEYRLPLALVAGLQAQRGQLCNLYAAQIQKQDPVKADMARLIGELIETNYLLYQQNKKQMEWHKEANEVLDRAKNSIDDAKRFITEPD